MVRRLFLTLLLFCTINVITLPAVAEDAAVASAQRLFKQYVDLERTFDPTQAELYTTDAVIRNTRFYPGGENKTITYSGEDYKKLLRAALPIAKLRNDSSTYSQVTYIKEGQNVRIKCTRFSNLKQYNSAFEMVVGPRENNIWKIIEESSQSRP